MLKPIKNFIKKNYQFIFCIFLLICIFIISFNPSPYISSTFLGIKIWSTIVLPSLFFFFVISKILLQLDASQKMLGFLNRPFQKIYNVSNGGGYIFLISILSGYPIGAKLISEFYEQGLIDKNDAKSITSFASTSGPMFIIGSVATKMYNNYSLGLVILVAHILSALINGLIFKRPKISTKQPNNKIMSNQNKKQTLNEIMYNTIISLLMVGGFITLCFTLLEIVMSFGTTKIISNFFYNLFGNNIFDCIIKGIVEVTNGCVSLLSSGLGIKSLCVILTAFISFGGLSIHLQSQMFLSKAGISYKYFLLTKTTQTIISIIISFILSLIFL